MADMLTEYKGFRLHATVSAVAKGYVPRVCLTRHNTRDTTEQILTPPCPQDGIPSEDAALKSAIDYGRAAIDGRIPGIDVSKMF